MSGYIRAVEEKTGSECLPGKQEPTRDHLRTYKDQQCRYCISLYDVKIIQLDEQTVKQLLADQIDLKH